jgi:RNA-directed DNA polymerase
MAYVNIDTSYECIISIPNLLDAWQEFVRGKKQRKDVQEFSRHLMAHVLILYEELATKRYNHGGYHAFRINDPKPRDIHKAHVRDRLVHHALYRMLYPVFDRIFIADSYSCRIGKGTHKALQRFRQFAGKVSRNNTRTCWVLKCDIRKFFASIDHAVLFSILRARVSDEKTLALLANIIESFSSTEPGKGLPLGNLTSQLLVNVYMNEFDHFAKHTLKAKYYIRYADDFVILSNNREWLIELLPSIEEFLGTRLALSLHPKKVSIRTLASGVDFLGWVHFPRHRVLRTATKRRMKRTLREAGDADDSVRASYRGMLAHGNTFKLRQKLEL